MGSRIYETDPMIQWKSNRGCVTVHTDSPLLLVKHYKKNISPKWSLLFLVYSVSKVNIKVLRWYFRSDLPIKLLQVMAGDKVGLFICAEKQTTIEKVKRETSDSGMWAQVKWGWVREDYLILKKHKWIRTEQHTNVYRLHTSRCHNSDVTFVG